ncbi:MAG: helix-turn-helix domain-containing protein [Prevotella sp.]|jgi:excisionase family DNA binding protein|nr:helix-turn-helix domain-containing protein [Prevotella sp.]
MIGKVQPAEKVWFSASELANYLGVSMCYVRSIRNSGRIKFYKPFGNKMIFFKKSDVDRFIEKGRQI